MCGLVKGLLHLSWSVGGVLVIVRLATDLETLLEPDRLTLLSFLWLFILAEVSLGAVLAKFVTKEGWLVVDVALIFIASL